MKKIIIKNNRDRKVAVKQFENTLKDVSSSTSYYYANRFKTYIKEVIESQSYKWKPLSNDYINWKKRTGKDRRTLISTSEYLNSIRVFKEKNGYVVGVPDKDHSDSKIPFPALLRYLEFGTRRMPARPHWRPAISNFLRFEIKR